MTAEVDICNLALSHLGDTATVASISPPEGSAQAQHCATFYPIARNTLLEMHDWGFATVRSELTVLAQSHCGWAYAYARPANVIRIISVKSFDVCGDEHSPSVPFVCEADGNGQQIILCNTPDVVAKYIALVTDVNRFSPLFVQALSWHLAAMLAGPMMKGDVGAAEAKRCASMAHAYLSQAAVSDANQRHSELWQAACWMKDR